MPNCVDPQPSWSRFPKVFCFVADHAEVGVPLVLTATNGHAEVGKCLQVECSCWQCLALPSMAWAQQSLALKNISTVPCDFLSKWIVPWLWLVWNSQRWHPPKIADGVIFNQSFVLHRLWNHVMWALIVAETRRNLRGTAMAQKWMFRGPGPSENVATPPKISQQCTAVFQIISVSVSIALLKLFLLSSFAPSANLLLKGWSISRRWSLVLLASSLRLPWQLLIRRGGTFWHFFTLFLHLVASFNV